MAESDSLKRFQIGFAMCVLLLIVMSTTLTHISYASWKIIVYLNIHQQAVIPGIEMNSHRSQFTKKKSSRNSSTPAHGVNSAGSLAAR